MATLTLTAALQQALQEIHVLDPGQTPSATQLADALLRMNIVLDNWSSDGLFVIALLRTTWALAANTQSYTIGAGQAINVARPVSIVSASFTNATGPGGQLEVVSSAKWDAIPDRQRQSWILEKLFYDRGNTTGTVWLSPVPLGTMAGIISSWAPLAQFVDATTPLTMLPGYERLIILALAIEMAPSYDVTPSDQTKQNYSDAIARVRHLNAQLYGTEPPSGDVTASAGAPISPNPGEK